MSSSNKFGKQVAWLGVKEADKEKVAVDAYLTGQDGRTGRQAVASPSQTCLGRDFFLKQVTGDGSSHQHSPLLVSSSCCFCRKLACQYEALLQNCLPCQ